MRAGRSRGKGSEALPGDLERGVVRLHVPQDSVRQPVTQLGIVGRQAERARLKAALDVDNMVVLAGPLDPLGPRDTGEERGLR